MDKKIAGILGAMATLGSVTAAEAGPASAPADVLRVNSYAELLEPIPNAVALLQAVDETTPAQTRDTVHLAQFYHHHHHHHHHHSFYRHHHHSYYPRVVVVPRYRRHHHHHHHHHHSFYRRDY